MIAGKWLHDGGIYRIAAMIIAPSPGQRALSLSCYHRPISGHEPGPSIAVATRTVLIRDAQGLPHPGDVPWFPLCSLQEALAYFGVWPVLGTGHSLSSRHWRVFATSRAFTWVVAWKTSLLILAAYDQRVSVSQRPLRQLYDPLSCWQPVASWSGCSSRDKARLFRDFVEDPASILTLAVFSKEARND